MARYEQVANAGKLWDDNGFRTLNLDHYSTDARIILLIRGKQCTFSMHEKRIRRTSRFCQMETKS